MTEAVAIALIFVGLFFLLTAALGMVKLPDLYTRLHAASKGTTFGFSFVVIGSAILLGEPSDIAKALLAVLFQFLTAPIGAHMIARVAVQKGIRHVVNPQGELADVRISHYEIEIPRGPFGSGGIAAKTKAGLGAGGETPDVGPVLEHDQGGDDDDHHHQCR